MDKNDFLAPWLRALDEEFGLCLEVEDQAQTLSRLYEARKAAADPRLDCLEIARMKDGTLWIVRKTRGLDE